MIMVLLNWLYIAITSFATGVAVLGFFSWIFKKEYNEKAIPTIFAGLAFNTVYAQTWSLFGGVGIGANIVLSLSAIIILVICRYKVRGTINSLRREPRSKRLLMVFYIVTVIIFAYGTSRGYIHYDTSLYHAQSIRWIEEYGVVKGLACLQIRFGYNSSAFALTALYSFASLLGQSLHTTAGFFCMLGALQVVDVYRVFSEKRVRHSDFIRIGLLFYLGMVFKEMVSPASDYYAQILIFSTLIMWLDALDEEKMHQGDEEGQLSRIYPYAMLSILLVYAATVKFSIALLVLLVIKPAYMLIKSRKIKQILACLTAGIAVLLPFFIRNVLISGWLIYPSTFIDLFDVDWKIPKGVAQYDAMEIGVYGKGINDVTKLDMPIQEWLPNWFRQMSVIEKGWVSLTVICLIAGLIYFLYKLIKKQADWDKMLVFTVISASCLFWFVTAPLVRYGYAYLTCVPLFVDGCLCFELIKKTNDKKSLYWAYAIVFAIIALYRLKTVGYDIINTLNQPYYLAQKDYEDWPAEEYEINGHTLYVPYQDALIGYNKFPASLMTIDIEMRGDDWEDGFRYKDYDAWLERSGVNVE